MMARKLWLVLAGLALVAGSAGPLRAQKPPYGVEEYNAYVDTTQSQDPAARLQAIDAFLNRYPDSVLRAFVYPNQAKTAFAAKRYPTVMEAVDNFLRMDREQVENLYKQSNYNDTQVESVYYEGLVLYTFSFLQSFRNGTPEADALAARAAERAGTGLELHQNLYSQFQPPADPAQRKQFEDNKQQQGASFHKVLAFVAWRKKDFAAAAREYKVLLGYTPNDPLMNYQLGLASLQQPTPDYRTGLWHVARAIALKVNKSEDVREYLTKVLSGYQQVVPECLTGQVNDLIARAGASPTTPSDWRLVSGDQVNAVRAEMSVKRIFDDLKVGGETAELMALASCGTEIGLGEGGQPELAVMIIDVTESPDNLVTLRVAAGQEAVDAKTANMQVKIVAPPEAKTLKAEDVVRISGKIMGFDNDPFLIKLAEGKVNAEDIPKAGARKRSGSAGR